MMVNWDQLQRSWNTLTNSLIRMPFLFECHLWDQIYFDKETNAGEDYFYKYVFVSSYVFTSHVRIKYILSLFFCSMKMLKLCWF